MTKTVLVLTAHADDMEFMAGGTIAKMADLGYAVRQVIATNNERGTLDPDWSPQFTADARREEAKRSAGVLGIDPEIEFLGYEDGFLGDVRLNELRERHIRAIRKHRPDVIFSWDAFAPYEDHPDHRAVAMAAAEAVMFSHFPLYHPEHRDEGLEPHYVGERYYFAKSPVNSNKTVDISGHIGKKVDALCAHTCQMEMTVRDLQMQLAASGLDVPMLRDADPKDYRPIIDTQIRGWAGAVGRKAGFEYGEEFRRVRFGGVEPWARRSCEELADDV